MKLLEECKQAKRIGISGHIRPDGGLCRFLYGPLPLFEKGRPDADLHIFLEKPADIFSCISSVEEIDSEYGEQERFDVFSPWILRPTAWEEQKRISTAL